MGITYWRQDFPNIKPRYEVFKLAGYDPETGLYWFASRDKRAFIPRSYSQLNCRGFYPFLLCNAAIDKFLAEGGQQYANS